MDFNLSGGNDSSLELSLEANSHLPSGFHLTKDSVERPHNEASGHTYDFLGDSKLMNNYDLSGFGLSKDTTQVQMFAGDLQYLDPKEPYLIEAEENDSELQSDNKRKFDDYMAGGLLDLKNKSPASLSSEDN